MMDNNMSKMNQILGNLQARYKQMDQLMSLTKEMAKAVDAEDGASLGPVLASRQAVMTQVDKLDAETKKLVAGLTQPYRDKMKLILAQTGEPVRLENPMETNIFDTNKRTMVLLKKILVLDEQVNKKAQNAVSNR